MPGAREPPSLPFLVDVGLDQLRAPVTVVALDEDRIGDIVQQAGENRFFRHGRLQRMGGALQQMVDALGAVLEKVEERGLRPAFSAAADHRPSENICLV